MKSIIKVLLLGICLIWVSCNKDQPSPSNEYTLNSDSNKGFLFESLKIVEFSNSSDENPDFTVLAQADVNGEVISPFLSHPDLENIFILSAEFDNIESAQAFYDSYLTPENKPFQRFALNIKPNQIWLIKTNTSGFGKILVTKTKIDNLNGKRFAEMTFKANKMK